MVTSGVLNEQAATAFTLEYAVDHNGAAAADRAGYSEARARQTAYELLHRPDVVAEVERLDADLVEKVGPTREAMLAEFLFITPEAKADRMPAMAGIGGGVGGNGEDVEAHGRTARVGVYGAKVFTFITIVNSRRRGYLGASIN